MGVWLRRVGLGLAGILALVILGAGAWLYDPLPANPPAAAALDKAKSYSAEIVRDAYGAPHIFGERDADAVFGLAYAHAEDDFETIQIVVAATRGDLARYRGREAAATDYVIRLLRIWETVDRDYDTRLSPEASAIAEAYADGINLYAAQNPDAAWRGLFPVTGKDVAAGFAFKTPLFYGLDETLGALASGDPDRAISLGPEAKDAFLIKPKSAIERGSNAIAVAPQRSGDGVTRLLINSHQPYEGPVAWYEAHLVSEEGLDVAGGVFPGAPVILHGFNRHVGWANTVNKPDLVDVYQLTLNPQNPDEYRLDGEWVPFDKRMAQVKVKLWGPFVFTAEREILRSEHGPVFRRGDQAFAIRFAGMDEIGQLDQYYALNRAQNFEEWYAGMALARLPSINYIYADKDGRIAFIHNAQYPERGPGWDWRLDLPGDRSDLIWRSYLPFDRVPKLIDPQSGLVWEANDTPFIATDGPDNLDPEDFASFMGLQRNRTNRGRRLKALTGQGEAISRERLLSIKFDKRYDPDSLPAQVVRDVLAHDWSQDPDMAQAAEHLAAWDLSTDKANRHAALGVLTTVPHVIARIQNKPQPGSLEAFREAARHLKTHHGRYDVPWGEINRLIRGRSDLALGGGPDILRAIYPDAPLEDGRLKAVAGDTWIALVEWGPDGTLTASTVHQYGTATLDETSPHYDDQAKLYAEERFRRFPMDRAEIEAQATRRYRPLDRETEP